MLKRLSVLLSVLLLVCFVGCSADQAPAQLIATTRPVYEFTARLCQGTDLRVSQLVTENVSCLHDYTLKADQMQALEKAELVIINGAGLEDFLDDALSSAQNVADASAGLSLMAGHDHGHEAHQEGHTHAEDPHIWLSPANAKVMAENICQTLCARYPQHTQTFRSNLCTLLSDLDALQAYGDEKLASLSCRELITFHDGFSYLAESFNLTVLAAVEEESGSEASAQTLIALIELVRDHDLPSIFTEINGADSAAAVIAAETGVNCYALDMAMAGDSYFDSMYYNINILWETLQ